MLANQITLLVLSDIVNFLGASFVCVGFTIRQKNHCYVEQFSFNFSVVSVKNEM